MFLISITQGPWLSQSPERWRREDIHRERKRRRGSKKSEDERLEVIAKEPPFVGPLIDGDFMETMIERVGEEFGGNRKR